MKKRGVVRKPSVSNKTDPKHKAKGHKAKEAGPAKKEMPTRRKALKRKLQKKPAQRKEEAATKPLSELWSKPTIPSEAYAEKEEEAVQKQIEKGVRLMLSREELPVVLFVCSLIVLAFLFESISLIFYTVATLATIWLGHFFHRHNHKPHDVIAIIGTFFLPLAATIVIYRDLLSWFLLFVYLLSAVSTVIIYVYHHRQHRLLMIMWQVTYSKIVALTAGAIIFSLMPFIMPTMHVSMAELLLIYIFPVVLAIFFLSKFLYIYYFEHKHIKKDMWLAIRHSVIYALAFVIIMTASYALLAVQMYQTDKDYHAKELDDALLDASRLDEIFRDQPAEMRNLPAFTDLEAYNRQVIEDVTAAKNTLLGGEISFGSILDDTYMQQLAKNSQATAMAQTKIKAVIDAKAYMTGRYQILQETLKRNASMPDGSKDLEAYNEKLKAKIDEKYLVYKLDLPLLDALEKMEDPATTFDYYEDNGFNWFCAQRQKWDRVYHSKSMFMKQVMGMLRHTYPFRVMATKNMQDFLFEDKERFSGHVQQDLFEKSERPEPAISKALRYEYIMEKADKTPKLLEIEYEQE
ncbi:TPA: hypothetical protein HA265_08500 [Candidatus Woesearchaeota archaeon]|nr:hypothetical protein [Candidatus Woesearchaeota archaeon]